MKLPHTVWGVGREKKEIRQRGRLGKPRAFTSQVKLRVDVFLAGL